MALKRDIAYSVTLTDYDYYWHSEVGTSGLLSSISECIDWVRKAYMDEPCVEYTIYAHKGDIHWYPVRERCNEFDIDYIQSHAKALERETEICIDSWKNYPTPY